MQSRDRPRIHQFTQFNTRSSSAVSRNRSDGSGILLSNSIQCCAMLLEGYSTITMPTHLTNNSFVVITVGPDKRFGYFGREWWRHSHMMLRHVIAKFTTSVGIHRTFLIRWLSAKWTRSSDVKRLVSQRARGACASGKPIHPVHWWTMDRAVLAWMYYTCVVLEILLPLP